jgi:cob(I)alamin adenosyltransferase
MKIYTKTGDQGLTSLYSGQRVPKYHDLIHATGTVDEFNSLLGSCVSFIKSDSSLLHNSQAQIIVIQVELVQSRLFSLGAHLSTPRIDPLLSDKIDEAKAGSIQDKQQRTTIDTQFALDLEVWIDQWQSELTPLTQFILPGGHLAAAAFHQARSLCRHAERNLCPLYEKGLIDQEAIKFLNRLSDYLFILARLINHLTSTHETVWRAH